MKIKESQRDGRISAAFVSLFPFIPVTELQIFKEPLGLWVFVKYLSLQNPYL